MIETAAASRRRGWRCRRSWWLLVLACLALAEFALALPPLQPISVRPAGVLGRQGNRHVSMGTEAVSGDGRYVVFSTGSNNLVSNDLRRNADVFLTDTETGELTRISQRPDGGEADGPSSSAAISGDGRWIVYSSSARNLLGQQGDSPAIHLHDRESGESRILSVPVAPSTYDGSYYPSISEDGATVVFTSQSRLLPSDVDDAEDAYAYDRATGSLRRVNVDQNGESLGGVASAVVARGGRYVVLDLYASGLVVLDLQTGVHDRIEAPQGSPGYNAYDISISADGSTLAFTSSTALVPLDNNGNYDVYVFDRATRAFELASVNSAGAVADGHSWSGSISPDARQVAFSSIATNLHPSANGSEQFFLRLRDNQTTLLLTRPVGGTPEPSSTQGGSCCAFSSDLRSVAFASPSAGLVKGDSNDRSDPFVIDLSTREIRRIGLAATPLAGGGTSTRSNPYSLRAVVGAEGDRVLFNHLSDNLVSRPWSTKLFMYDRDWSHFYNPVDVSPPPAAYAAIEVPVALSDDGRHMLYRREPLRPGGLVIPMPPPPEPWDLWLEAPYYYGRVDTSALMPPNAKTTLAQMSGDASRVAWVSSGSDSTLRRGAYVRDFRAGTTRRLDAAVDEPPVDAATGLMLGLSRNGRYAVFASAATGLVPDAADGRFDLFLRNLDTWELTRLVHPMDGSALVADGWALVGSGLIGEVGVSDDGQVIAFGADLDQWGYPRVFRLDRANGRLDHISRSWLPEVGDSTTADSVSMSADGSRIAFRSPSSLLFEGATARQIYLYDATVPSLTLVSRDPQGRPGNLNSAAPHLSASGAALVFSTHATGLDAAHPAGDGDVYLQFLPASSLFRSGFEADGDLR